MYRSIGQPRRIVQRRINSSSRRYIALLYNPVTSATLFPPYNIFFFIKKNVLARRVK
jgi:hypothetical protein